MANWKSSGDRHLSDKTMIPYSSNLLRTGSGSRKYYSAVLPALTFITSAWLRNLLQSVLASFLNVQRKTIKKRLHKCDNQTVSCSDKFSHSYYQQLYLHLQCKMSTNMFTPYNFKHSLIVIKLSFSLASKIPCKARRA
jgi:hypothetical protein